MIALMEDGMVEGMSSAVDSTVSIMIGMAGSSSSKAGMERSEAEEREWHDAGERLVMMMRALMCSPSYLALQIRCKHCFCPRARW
jgi:hypothetical protein